MRSESCSAIWSPSSSDSSFLKERDERMKHVHESSVKISELNKYYYVFIKHCAWHSGIQLKQVLLDEIEDFIALEDFNISLNNRVVKSTKDELKIKEHKDKVYTSMISVLVLKQLKELMSVE